MKTHDVGRCRLSCSLFAWGLYFILAEFLMTDRPAYQIWWTPPASKVNMYNAYLSLKLTTLWSLRPRPARSSRGEAGEGERWSCLTYGRGNLSIRGFLVIYWRVNLKWPLVDANEGTCQLRLQRLSYCSGIISNLGKPSRIFCVKRACDQNGNIKIS